MGTMTDTINVEVDVTTAYNQWTQFEEFPEFMGGVEQVRQLTDSNLHWVYKVGPVVREFDAVITEQVPDEAIAWQSVNGPEHTGRVTFRAIDGDTTEVTTDITIEPEGILENVGDATGVIEAMVKGDLRRFKDFIESRGIASGAWRGELPDSENGQRPDRGME